MGRVPLLFLAIFFFFQAEDGIRDGTVTGVQTCALPISPRRPPPARRAELEAPLPGPRRQPRVRRHRDGLLATSSEAPPPRGRLHRDHPLPQQPQAPVRVHTERDRLIRRRAVCLPSARPLLDADLAARYGAVASDAAEVP